MNWFESLLTVDRHMRQQDDDELSTAWQRFLESPFPHIWGFPPSEDGAAQNESLKGAHQFLKTAMNWRGGGLELLIFRLVQAIEELPILMGYQPPDRRDWIVRIQCPKCDHIWVEEPDGAASPTTDSMERGS